MQAAQAAKVVVEMLVLVVMAPVVVTVRQPVMHIAEILVPPTASSELSKEGENKDRSPLPVTYSKHISLVAPI